MQWSKVHSLKVTLNLPVWPGNKSVVNAQSGAEYWSANVQGDHKSTSTREHSGRKHIHRMAVPETPPTALVVSCVCIKRAVMLGRVPSFEKTLPTLLYLSHLSLWYHRANWLAHVPMARHTSRAERSTSMAHLTLCFSAFGERRNPANQPKVLLWSLWLTHASLVKGNLRGTLIYLFFMSNIIIPSLIGRWWQQVFLSDMTSWYHRRRQYWHFEANFSIPLNCLKCFPTFIFAKRCPLTCENLEMQLWKHLSVLLKSIHMRVCSTPFGIVPRSHGYPETAILKC